MLDRDGVINQELSPPAAITEVKDWQPIPGAIEAIGTLQAQADITICSNQSALGRGTLTPTELRNMHAKLSQLLEDQGAEPVDMLFCPHHPDDGCACRKPEPGMLEQIATAAGASQECWFVGDSKRDLEAGIAAGLKVALCRQVTANFIPRGQGSKTFPSFTACQTLLTRCLLPNPVRPRMPVTRPDSQPTAHWFL